MQHTTKNLFAGTKTRALTSVSLGAMIAALAAGQAQAQTPAPAQSAQAPAVDEIVVTGSRVVRDGYEAPTPVTVVGVEQMQSSGFPNLFDAVRTRPAFASGTTRSSLPKEMPARVACAKPRPMIRSAKITVSFCPQLR